MKKLLALVVVLFALPMVFANSVGIGTGVDIVTEEFEPLVWLCDSRVTCDDLVEPGRPVCQICQEQYVWECGPDCTTPACVACNGEEYCTEQPTSYECVRTTTIHCFEDFSGDCDSGLQLIERFNNYAFEGEQIKWTVLVMDKNGIEKVQDVFVTIGDVQGAGNDIEANCVLTQLTDRPEDMNCNARILEERITEFNPRLMRYYECTFTVETPLSMYGEYWVTVEAMDLSGLSGTMAENEYWFLNPEISLSLIGNLIFDNVRPGTSTYSETLLVGNDADDGSGVMLDMFITGTNFYDSSSSGAMCPTSNVLTLNAFSYYAVNGAYNTRNDPRTQAGNPWGYVGINYGIGFNDPNPFYNNAEIMQVGPKLGPYWMANLLAPGAEMAVTFKLDLPEPCNGNFDTGSIYFWGEAV